MLHIGNNNVGCVDESLFRDLHKLTKLTLGGNGINEIRAGTFTGLQDLKHLDLSDNNLQVDVEKVCLFQNSERKESRCPLGAFTKILNPRLRHELLFDANFIHEAFSQDSISFVRF